MAVHLTRIYTNCDLSFLAPLLHIETENTLANHLLGQPILEGAVSVSMPPPGLRSIPIPRQPYRPGRSANCEIKQPNSSPSVHLS